MAGTEDKVHEMDRVTLSADEALSRGVLYFESDDGVVHGKFPLSQLKTALGVTGGGVTPTPGTGGLVLPGNTGFILPDGSLLVIG